MVWKTWSSRSARPPSRHAEPPVAATLAAAFAVAIVAWTDLAPTPALAIGERGFAQAYSAKVLPYFRNAGRLQVFNGKDGVPIRYISFEKPMDHGAIVILGGRGESLLKYAELAYDWRGTGYSLFIMDHRGQGFSGRMLPDRQKGYVKSFDDYVADAGTFIDHVVKSGRKPLQKVFLIGHSMGGAIAILHAIHHPRDIAAIALCSPMFGINTGRIPEMAVRALLPLFELFGLSTAYVPGEGPFDLKAPNIHTRSEIRFRTYRETLQEYPEALQGGATNAWLSASMKGMREIRDRAAQATDPILLLEAGQDRIVRTEAEDEACSKAADCRKIRFADAYHELIIEKDDTREPMLRAILDFFGRH